MSIKNLSGRVECCGRLRLQSLPPTVSHLSTRREILDISQPYWPPDPAGRPLSQRRFLVNFSIIRLTEITLMMKALDSSETSVLTRATWCNITEDGILHSLCRDNYKSYIALTGWTL
jgi:hypothetical protein